MSCDPTLWGSRKSQPGKRTQGSRKVSVPVCAPPIKQNFERIDCHGGDPNGGSKSLCSSDEPIRLFREHLCSGRACESVKSVSALYRSFAGRNPENCLSRPSQNICSR